MKPEYEELYDIAFDLKCCRTDPVKVMEQYIRIMKLAIKMNEEHNALPTRNERV